MKLHRYLIIVFGLILNSCSQSSQSKDVKENQIKTPSDTDKSLIIENSKNKKVEIQNLIRELLKWADSKNSIDLLPAVTDKTDSIYIGFDLNQLKQNLSTLRETNFFTEDFIENYNQIILTLDRELKANKFEYNPWLVGDLPPFYFASDMNPWCLCQDNMDWNLVEIEQINGNEYIWKWGRLNEDTHQSWKDFSYKFKVSKEKSKWKISYLDGFNIKKIKK